MSTIITRSGKGSPLTNAELDANFENLNTDKLEISVGSVVSSASITPAYTNTQYNVTALAVDATINAPSGTPVDSRKLIIRIKDDGTSRALTWNAIYRAVDVTLPTATTAGKTTFIGMVYNAAATKMDVFAISTEV